MSVSFLEIRQPRVVTPWKQPVLRTRLKWEVGRTAWCRRWPDLRSPNPQGCWCTCGSAFWQTRIAGTTIGPLSSWKQKANNFMNWTRRDVIVSWPLKALAPAFFPFFHFSTPQSFSWIKCYSMCAPATARLTYLSVFLFFSTQPRFSCRYVKGVHLPSKML